MYKEKPTLWETIVKQSGLPKGTTKAQVLGRVIGATLGRFIVGATYAAGVLAVAQLWGVI